MTQTKVGWLVLDFSVLYVGNGEIELRLQLITNRLSIRAEVHDLDICQ